MKNSKNIFRLIFAIIIINVGGYFLRLKGLDTYIILAGFRFQISLIIPFFFIYTFSDNQLILQKLKNPNFNKTLPPLLWIFLPIIILAAVLFLAKKFAIGDPEYFYEFGLSSIVDFPIYLIWNLPELFLFGVTIILLINKLKIKSLVTTITITVAFFIYAILPVKGISYEYINSIIIFICIINFAILMSYLQNIYWIAIYSFTSLWCVYLAFGSNNPTAINLLFASQYSSWDGFFEVNKTLNNYIIVAYLVLSTLMILLSVKKQNRSLKSQA